jgi:hypothetical protein
MTDIMVIHIIVNECFSRDNGALFLLCLDCNIFYKVTDKAQYSKVKEPAEIWTWVRTDIKRMVANGMRLLGRTE